MQFLLYILIFLLLKKNILFRTKNKLKKKLDETRRLHRITVDWTLHLTKKNFFFPQITTFSLWFSFCCILFFKFRYTNLKLGIFLFLKFLLFFVHHIERRKDGKKLFNRFFCIFFFSRLEDYIFLLIGWRKSLYLSHFHKVLAYLLYDRRCGWLF